MSLLVGGAAIFRTGGWCCGGISIANTFGAKPPDASVTLPSVDGPGPITAPWPFTTDLQIGSVEPSVVMQRSSPPFPESTNSADVALNFTI